MMESGCQLLRPTTRKADDTTNYCIQPAVFTTDTLQTVTSGAAGMTTWPALSADTAGLPPLSIRSRQLALAYGLGPTLRQLTRGDHLAFGKQRAALVRQVSQAATDALRMYEELECQHQRADQAALALQAAQIKRTNQLTVGSLLFGAASGTISATVQDRNTNLVLTVITAGLSAGLGVGTLLVKDRYDYPVSRNLLAPVWYEYPRPALYPPGLWVVLNQPRTGRIDGDAPAPIHTLHRRWAQYDQLGGPHAAAQQALYFGAGGYYQLDDLHTRSAMLSQVQAMVQLINQDLLKLLGEVSSLGPP